MQTSRRAPKLAKNASHRFRDWAVHRRIWMPDRSPMYWYKEVRNLGDQLSPKILSWVTGLQPVWVTRRYRGKILAVGSILEALAARDVVWGAGLIRDRFLTPPPDVRFLAVRGPLTRARIRADVPEIYGDPAVLLPMYHTAPVERRYTLGIVPHYVDYGDIAIDDPAIMVVDVRDTWETVVDAIRSCDVILSSSLHGLAVAEAYGVPASWVKMSDEILGGEFKFHDYYLATGRDLAGPTLWSDGMNRAVANIPPSPVFNNEALLDSALGLRRHEGRLNP